MSRIWHDCCQADASDPPFVALRGRLLRLVESQEQVATNTLVRNAAEQAVLEQILERSKPALRSGTEDAHYLLQAPFRYPPLAHGSRFGSRLEPSIFYGSREEHTLLAEGAFYRFWFFCGMRLPPPGPLRTQHTVFAAGCRTTHGLRLQAPPFAAYEDLLRDPCRYTETQALGTAMRAAGVIAFEYRSARDSGGGLNIALLEPRALSPRRRILSREEWACETSAQRVVWFNPARQVIREFPLETFLVDGVLPVPAA